MGSYSRYAIYFAPVKESPLAELWKPWLGWDPDEGMPVGHLEPEGLPRALESITATPRKYGFHGTLKPPFRLKAGYGFEQLDAALAEFAQEEVAFQIDRMGVAALGKFVAIVPLSPSPALSEFAASCVRNFDKFRDKLTEAELQKRRKSGLTSRQETLLSEWGYPYVMDEFRFHLTLSGALASEEVEAVSRVATKTFAGALETPVSVEELCLFGERTDGAFEIIKRYTL